MRIHLILMIVAGLLCLGSCDKAKAPAQTAAMGDKLSVGPITYSVFESSWKPELQGNSGPRTPKNRFLILRLTVTNGGGKDFSLPLLRLESADGKTYLEEDSGEGVAEWLGLIRIIKSNQTADGRILFDVPPGGYRLQVVDDGDLENQQVKYVDVPFNVEPTVKVPAPGEQ